MTIATVVQTFGSSAMKMRAFAHERITHNGALGNLYA